MDDNTKTMEDIVAAIKQCCIVKNEKYKEDKESSVHRKKMAKLFQQLGNLYLDREDGNKFNYIYSAGIFAAAALRDPTNLDNIHSDMQNLWEKVLNEANASKPESKLLEICDEVKASVKSLRDSVSNLLNEIPCVQDNSDDKKKQEENKIFFIREILLSHISKEYVAIMKSISDTCCSILFNNEPPCKFSHVALGSLARQDATAYSDFENMILIDDNCSNNENVIDQFRWYSVMFQIIVIGLEESPVRLLGIPALNDFSVKDKSKDWFYDIITKCGIQFDSNESTACVHPLGHQPSTAFPFKRELIKSVDDMVSYIFKTQLEKHPDEYEESEFHLSNVLSKSVFVAGDEGLYNQYNTAVNKRLDDNKDRIIPMLTDSLKSFDSLNVLCGVKINARIKELMFRASTLLISYIGNLLQIRDPNCFAIVDTLVQTEHLSEEAGHNLKYAVAVANEVRMKVYEEATEQVREVNVRLPRADEDEASDLLRIVGKCSILDFFDIIRCLWLSLRRFVFGNLRIEDTRSLSGPMRGGSETATRAVYASLGLVIDRPEVSEEEKLEISGPDASANALNDAVPFAKTFCFMVIDVIRSMIAMISDYEDIYSNEDEIRSKFDERLVIYKCQSMMNAVQHCNFGFAQRDEPKVVSSYADIAAYFFTLGYGSPLMDEFVISVQKIQRFVHGYIEDRHLVSQLPNVLHLMYKVADFTSVFRHFKHIFLLKLKNDKVSREMYNALDQITACLMNIKLQLEQLKYTVNEWKAPQPILKIVSRVMDDGIFDYNNLQGGVDGWPERVDVTRNNLLKINEFAKAINDKNPVFQMLFMVKDWSFIVSAYSKVVIRDVALCMGDITELKSQYDFLKGNYELAMQECIEVEKNLRQNYRDKNHHKAKMAENKKAIAMCSFQMGNFSGALDHFRNEMNFRFENLLKRTTTEQIVNNFVNQARCLKSLNLEEQAKTYLATADIIDSNHLVAREVLFSSLIFQICELWYIFLLFGK